MANDIGVERRRPRWCSIAAVAIFVLLLALLTRALLMPIPAGAVESVGGGDSSFWISKTLHVAVYALLAWMAVRFPIAPVWRIALLLFLVLHGCGTEYLQQFVGRGYSIRDAALDLIGVTIGALIGWRFSRRRETATS